jgi:hypothetical protein
MRLNLTRSPNTRFVVSCLAAVAMILALLPAALALPIGPNGVFELEGDAVSSTSNSGPPDDWDRVCHQVLNSDCSTTFNTNGASAVSFASQTASGGTTFTGGGSKDPIDVSSWAWNQAAGGLPAKDVLLNGFAARYTVPSTGPSDPTCPAPSAGTCSVIFFGMDRFDNSGDAQNGFWFFQNPITLGTNKIGGGQGFVGVHKDGDLLVVSDFSNGGGTSTISVYIWDHTCTAAGKPVAACADSNLRLLQTSTAANCATAAANAAFCGIVNPSNGTTAPWSFTDKSGFSTFLQGEFFEGGINLSAFPGLAAECFASTLAESRASTSTSATLKSFVLSNFGKCESGTKTTPTDGNGNPITSISIGTGSVQVKDQAVVTVLGAGSFDGDVTFHLCGPDPTLGVSATCSSGGTLIGSAKTVAPPSPVTVLSDAATVTSVGNYCWRADYSGDAAQGVPASSDSSLTECFKVTPVTPTLTTQASGPVQLGQAISDTANLSGTASEPGTPVINPTTPGSPAKGTITFTVYGPNNCTTVAGTSMVNVNGDGAYGSGNFVPTAVGTYTFVATYSGDPPNTNGAGPTACPDPTGTETVLITDTSTNATTQNWLPNDSATITTTGGSPVNGTVTLTLYNNGACDPGVGNANVLYTTGPMPVVSGVSPLTVTSNNTTVKVTSSTTVSWRSTFVSSDSNVAGSTSNCETTSLTITN